MDRITIIKKIQHAVKDYKYVVLILAVGILIMMIPAKNDRESKVYEQTEEKELYTLEQSLSDLLSKIEGAGKVEILLTQSQGEKKLYQTDQDTGYQENQRISTVIITDSGKNQQGLVQQIISPVYLGAVIICQGADDASVRYAIVDAVSNVTGLSTDKISVLKMK